MKYTSLFLIVILSIVFSKAAYSQNPQNITGSLTYDYNTGQLSLDTKYPIGNFQEKQTPRNRIIGLRDGQGVAITVKNINPLKYYAESSAMFITTTTAPRSITAINVDDLFKEAAKPEVVANSDVAAKTDSEIKPHAPGVAEKKGGKKPVAKPIPPKPDAAKVQELKGDIECIKINISNIETQESTSKQLGNIFQSFNDYYSLVKTRDNIDETKFKNDINDILVNPLKNITSTGFTKAITTPSDVSRTNLNLIKKDLTDNIDRDLKNMNDCYDKLFDNLIAHPNEKNALLEEIKNDKNNLKTDLMLAQLPETRKEYYKLQDWAKSVKETITDKLWPKIDSSINIYLFCQDLRFEIPAGTVMADEDLVNITLSIKNVSDNKEVKKIERIKFHTVGGFRLEYGVGLYATGLSDEEFVLDRTTKIEKVTVLDGTTLDSVLQNVNYTTPKKASAKNNLNWGAMTFFQGRSNWGSWINIGGYFGLGLLLNNSTKPIFSAGGSIVFGRIPRGNLNIGTAWGKVDRLNPKYTLNQENKGDITDPTVQQTHSRLLIGITWNLGKINTSSGSSSK